MQSPLPLDTAVPLLRLVSQAHFRVAAPYILPCHFLSFRFVPLKTTARTHGRHDSTYSLHLSPRNATTVVG